MPVFVDYYADWCGPCKMMAPLVEKMEEKFQGKIKIGKCNIDENMEIAQTYKVASIPTFILFKEGIAVGTYVGAMSAKELEDILEQALL